MPLGLGFRLGQVRPGFQAHSPICRHSTSARRGMLLTDVGLKVEGYFQGYRKASYAPALPRP